MKKITAALFFGMIAATAHAEDINVTSVRYAGPYNVIQPVMIDTIDAAQKKYDDSAVLNTQVKLAAAAESSTVLSADANGKIVLPSAQSQSIALVGFTLSNTSFVSAPLTIDGLKNYKLYVDGKETFGTLNLEPAVHTCVIKYLAKAGASDTISIKADNRLKVGDSNGAKRTFTIGDVMNCATYGGVSISPNGKYVIYSTSQTLSAAQSVHHSYVKELATGRIIDDRSGVRWMPSTNKYYYTRQNEGSMDYTLICVDPVTRQEQVLSTNVPQAYFTMSPTEDYIIYNVTTKGPAEKSTIYEVLTPEDRQPGWRNRSSLYRFDLKTGMNQQLTFGYHNVSLQDISRDGKHILFSVYEDRYTARPTSLASTYRLNMQTMAMDTVVLRDGFTAGFQFSPDGTQILAMGSPESFGGVGMNVKEGQTPSNFDYQLYLIDCADMSKVTPLTRDFNPSVGRIQWSAADGMVYFTAEDKDCVHLFRLNPKSGKIARIDIPEEIISSFAMASAAPSMAWYGESASNYSRMYTMNTKTLKSTKMDELNSDRMAEIQLGKCEAWNWVNPEGDTIVCRYYLPADFDASKKYPMIVNYYGGCSPTSRNFATRYPQHAYAALGYVVLVVNPRGATGFGQKWSAVHVNTAGQNVADDIIGAVRNFCAEHQYVNDKKIGCIGASYGGFMTQYLQTVTDIFAAGVSHAGISDHTSYWGYGYWGYSYSETSMANSYPWTRKDLFVDQSPLYRADKVHTPLLFVHGTGDTNVPVNESIQMYTALKLLGRETAMVLVEGENHWILEYQKRIDWQNTIWAWFAKYLQDNDSWWENMYKHKCL